MGSEGMRRKDAMAFAVVVVVELNDENLTRSGMEKIDALNLE